MVFIYQYNAYLVSSKISEYFYLSTIVSPVVLVIYLYVLLINGHMQVQHHLNNELDIFFTYKIPVMHMTTFPSHYKMLLIFKKKIIAFICLFMNSYV